MASYTERVNAKDSYITNINDIISRPSTLKMIASFEMTGYQSNALTAYQSATILFPPPQSHPKKRITGWEVYIYVTDKDYYGYGALPAGDFIYQLVDGWKGGASTFMRFQSYKYGSKYALENISLNKYLLLEFFKSEKIAASVGVTGNLYAKEEYEASASLSFRGHSSSTPPYAIYQLEDVIPFSRSQSPISGFVNEKSDITFSWAFAYTRNRTTKYGGEYDILEPIFQQSAKFRWRPYGETSYTEIVINGDIQSITIPANTFSTDKIQWQVIVTSDDGIEGTPSDWFTLSTVDSEPSTKAVSPVDVMVDGGQPIEFKWKHIINTGSPQSKFDLEYSDDNGLTWKPLKSEETADTFTVIPADTLPSGNLLWRVRTYNSDGQPGEYSASASFVVRAAPPVPTISSVTAEARPVVRWQAVGQQAYEVDILDAAGKQVYTTGETAGTDKEQKITEYLDAGTYTVRVRVWNIYGIASPWADASVTVPELDKAPPELSGWASSGVARLTRIAGDYLFYYLLRDGEPIAKLPAGQTEYLDYTVLGQHQYVLRGVTAQDQFKDSAAVRLNVRVPYAMLAPADDPGNWVELVYRRGGEPTRAENLTITGQAVFAAGRTLPFFESNGQRTKDWSFNYSFRTLEEYQALVDLVQQGKTVLYRGKDGSRCWVALTGIQTSADYLSRDYTLSAIEVDRIETIEYD